MLFRMLPFAKATFPWVVASAIVSTVLALLALVLQWTPLIADVQEALSFVTLCVLLALGLSTAWFFKGPEQTAWGAFSEGFFLVSCGATALLMAIALMAESWRLDLLLYMLLGLFVPLYLVAVLGYNIHRRFSGAVG